jgi:hypothetical protein
MPVKIEDIHTELCTLIETELAGYKRFPNPYQIDANTFIHMTKGYGVAVGPGVDTERTLGCTSFYERVFTVVLVNKMTKLQNDTDSREMVERDLLVDHDTLRKAIYKTTLDGNCIKATLSSDNGVQFIDADLQKFLAMELSVTIEYQDAVT